LDTEFVPVTKLADSSHSRLAETVLPVRMAEICASFPYKKQLQEFMKQLQLPDVESVLSEGAEDDKGHQVPAFRFLGVRTQRRIVDAEGKPLPNSKWENIDDINLKLYKDLLILSGKRLEPENANLSAISFPGLVMKRLQQFREDQYPDIEPQLPSIKKTLDN